MNLFGIEALRDDLEMFLTYALKERGDWTDVNIQKNSEIKTKESGLGVCLHYELIELCAEIVGIKPSELAYFDRFCGFFKKDIMVSGPFGGFSKLGGEEQVPFQCCEAIASILKSRLELLKAKKPESIQISKTPSENELEKVQEFVSDDHKFKSGQKVYSFWKGVVPKKIGMREMKYSKKKLIAQIENLILQLNEKAAMRDPSSIFGVICKVAPKWKHNQWLHID